MLDFMPLTSINPNNPVVVALNMAPVICEWVVAGGLTGGLKGYVKALNPKAEVRFTELMSRDDDACRYRIEIME